MVYALFVVACISGEPMEPQYCTTVPVPTFFPSRDVCEVAKQQGDTSAERGLSDFDVAISICVPVDNMSPPGTHIDS